MTIFRIVTDLNLTSLESIQTKIGSNRMVNKSKITFYMYGVEIPEILGPKI